VILETEFITPELPPVGRTTDAVPFEVGGDGGLKALGGFAIWTPRVAATGTLDPVWEVAENDDVGILGTFRAWKASFISSFAKWRVVLTPPWTCNRSRCSSLGYPFRKSCTRDTDH
jgi:hypothetical protein